MIYMTDLVYPEKSCKSCLNTNWVFFSVGVRAVCGDDVADPPERAARPKPETRRQDQPQYPRQYAAVVELANARNNQTQDSRQHWIAHRSTHLHKWKHIRQPCGFCSFSARRQRAARRRSRRGRSSASFGQPGYSPPSRAAAVSPAAPRPGD